MTSRIIKKAEVLHRCGIASATLYRYISSGCFPSQVRLSPQGRAVGWRSEDIDAWIASRMPVKG
ncbi:helix-turn-helix transcriptional regulator [Pantoea sp. UBA5035]|uniref:helix-turn-helix transcriptional regulator n=1 Tax=Pantoea sp. UBA5035 TaxID=1947035 RepID=UPI00257BF609|nr:AlpA family phage regulatory protein [Pantoea sp. UBA5035]